MNFALASEHATAVDLCLFDSADDRRETHRLPIRERTDHIWHLFLPDASPGLCYGYRVHGAWDPDAGHRFNPSKLLLDPYALAIAGDVTWSPAMFDYRGDGPDGNLGPDDRDNAPHMPRSVVVDPAFSWGDDRPPRTPWGETVLYELHVKGVSVRHPEVPPGVRGTYAGLAAPAMVAHLKQLGITAVELLPVHHSVTEKRLRDRGLSNYWGYNSIGFFCPDSRFASSGDRGQQVAEFKTMVKTLHQAGIEVILDVVYNHTAEGDHLGPTLCFRGIDNAAYYRLAEDRRHYLDYTGCGNTLNAMHPRTLQLVMDSLRYWVLDMHVDGFRFDLAAALARERHGVDPFSSFFDVIAQDPVVSRVKLIAEPWDVGDGGYQLGNFPAGWTEWNGKFRDTVRRYWRGDEGQVADLGYRLTGSSDLYASSGRSPHASLNFITCHDGFTLADLVSYNAKQNAANGEDNRDGADENFSWNSGLEGPTDDPAIIELRQRQMRNLLATLLLSQGVPMLCAGDEAARSQQGNNNAYCQDNEISWLAWPLVPAARRQLEFTRHLIQLRLENPVFHRRTFFRGGRIHASDLSWFRPDGKEMTEEEWTNGVDRCLGLYLAGDAIDEVDDLGEPVVGDTFLVLINANHDAVPFILPAGDARVCWEPTLDTRGWEAPDPARAYRAGDHYDLAGRALAVLRRRSRGLTTT